MIHVDGLKIEFGRTKGYANFIPLFNTMSVVGRDVIFKAEITSDLHYLYIALMERFGYNEVLDMMEKASSQLAEDYVNSNKIFKRKENKDHD